MKKLIVLFFVSIVLVSCSKDDDPVQDYTSFTLTWIGGNSGMFSNYKTAYFDESGACILLFEHDQLEEGVETKEYIMPVYADKIYLFYEWDPYFRMRLKESLAVKKNVKNKIILPDRNDPSGIEIRDTSSIYDWPH